MTGHPSVASVTGQLTGHLKRFFYLSHGENHGVFRELSHRYSLIMERLLKEKRLEQWRATFIKDGTVKMIALGQVEC